MPRRNLKYQRWTAAEESVMYQYWHTGDMDLLMRMLPDREEPQIIEKAIRMGLKTRDDKMEHRVGISVTDKERNAWLVKNWRPNQTVYIDYMERIERRIMGYV